MEFWVKLIKTAKLKELSGVQVFDLMCNATHVRGEYWIFEGEEDALIADVEVVAEGATPGTGDMENKELVEHCLEIFGEDLSKEPHSYEMY